MNEYGVIWYLITWEIHSNRTDRQSFEFTIQRAVKGRDKVDIDWIYRVSFRKFTPWMSANFFIGYIVKKTAI